MPRRGQGGRPSRRRGPLDPVDSDDEFKAERRADAKDKFESAMYNLKFIGFSVKYFTRDVIITCKHGTFKRQLPWTLEAYEKDPHRWAQLTEQIRSLHRRQCGKE